MTVIPGFAPDLLNNQLALVTGAARGIGFAISETLAACGAQVILADIDKTEADQAAEKIGGNAKAYELDISDARQCHQAASEFPNVSILINNAGIFRRCATEDAEGAHVWRQTMAINADGPYHMVRAFLPALKTHQGAIVNIVSSRAFTAAEHAAAYSTSKAALVMLTKSLAVEHATSGIRVNAVAPSDVITDMTAGLYSDPVLGPKLMSRTPLRRPARPEEIATAVVFLASPLASFITGAVLNVDGGFLST